MNIYILRNKSTCLNVQLFLNPVQKMLSKSFWITLTIVTSVSSHIEIRDGGEFNVCARGNRSDHQRVHDGCQTNAQELFGNTFESCMKEFVPFSDVSETCTRDGQRFVDGLNSRILWAVQMYDSSSKYPNRISTGNVVEMGDFDRCISVSSKQFGIHGAYVLVSIQFHSINDSAFDPNSKDENHQDESAVSSKRDALVNGPDSMLWAVCVPDSCDGDDVRVSVERVLKPTFRTRGVAVNVAVPPPMYTSKSTALPYSRGFYLTVVMFIGAAALTVLGTLYKSLADRSKTKQKTEFFEGLLRSFSITDNMKSLTTTSDKNNIAIIDGFKVMGLIQMICFHRVVLNLTIPTLSSEFHDHIYDDFWLGFLKTQVPVESFFVMSGFLMYVNIENLLKNGHRFNLMQLIIYRSARFLPLYIVIILLFAFILPHMSGGPLWKLIIHPTAESCQENWWTNMLFINTYVDSYNMCLFHSWYLACDMHFFVIGVLLTYVVHRRKKLGVTIFGLVTTLSVVVPAKYIYDNRLWAFIPILRSNGQDIRKFEVFHSLYVKSEFRLTTYLIGIVAANVYLHVRNSKFKLSTNVKIVSLAACFFLMYICMAATGYFYLPNVAYNPRDHALFFTLQRLTYALCVSYLIVVGSLSNLGIVSSLVESRVCAIVSRLSYVAYMIHPLVQMLSISQIRQPQYHNIWTLVAEIAGDLTTTLACSIVLNLIVESPIRKIVNHLRDTILKEPSDSNICNRRNTVQKKIPLIS